MPTSIGARCPLPSPTIPSKKQRLTGLRGVSKWLADASVQLVEDASVQLTHVITYTVAGVTFQAATADRETGTKEVPQLERYDYSVLCRPFGPGRAIFSSAVRVTVFGDVWMCGS